MHDRNVAEDPAIVKPGPKEKTQSVATSAPELNIVDRELVGPMTEQDDRFSCELYEISPVNCIPVQETGVFVVMS